MNSTQTIVLLSNTLVIAVPLLLAGLGELVSERSGVLNLGVEGMMLIGAVAGYAVTVVSGHQWLGLLAAGMAGMLMAVLFGLLVLVMLARDSLSSQSRCAVLPSPLRGLPKKLRP